MKLTVLGYDETPLIWERLNAVLDEARSLETDSTDWPEVTGVIAASWNRLGYMDDLSFVLKGALIDALSTIKMEEYDEYLWQRTQIARDMNGLYLAPSATWQLFIKQHLGMKYTTAMNLKLTYQVFYHKVGFTLQQMLVAGRSKLKLARKFVEGLHPGRDEEIMEALIGALRCGACDGTQQEDDPWTCESCGEKYEPVKPDTYTELEALLKKRALAPDDGVRIVIEGDVEADDVEIRVVASIIRDGETVYLPLWEIPLLSPGTIGEGVPEDWLQEVMILLQRKF